MICMMPSAPADETADGFMPDSAVATEVSMLAGRLYACEAAAKTGVRLDGELGDTVLAADARPDIDVACVVLVTGATLRISVGVPTA
jgi:hypothetical protein